VAFVERAAIAPVGGAQTLTVDFAGTLGTVARPKFGDGAVTLAAQLQRGSLHSGFIHGSAANDPRVDVTLPTLTRAGPPNLPGTEDVLTDQPDLAFFGTASETVAAASLTDGTSTAQLFAAGSDGRFVTGPIPLGRLTAPRNYSLTLTDRAGNVAAAAVTGRILQRGLVTGVQAGTLTVEAYDDATLQPVAGAVVVVDPGAPTVPPAAGRMTASTGATGRAVFTGLVAPSHTVTVVAAGYHLTTLYDSGVEFASLPLRPMAGATANLQGNAAFSPTPNATALIGNNAFDDPLLLAARTLSSSPNTIPTTAIRPFRAQLVTAFSGVFEPTAVPAFAGAACSMCGADGVTRTPPNTPVSPGGTGSVSLVVLPVAGTPGAIGGLALPYVKDFAAAAGLDTGNLAGPPIVRVTASLAGLTGQSLLGVGFVTAAGGANFLVNANWVLPALVALAPFTPVTWVVTEAQDGGGNVSRHRALLNPTLGSVIDPLPPPSIPVVTPPGGPSTGPPSVTFDDRLDSMMMPGALALAELVAEDGAGRRWRLLQEDNDPQGGTRTVQFPDLAGTGAVGLAPGTWRIRAEARLYLSATAAPGDVVLEERRGREGTWARSAPVSFTVQ
jgi:hypothetical protein